MPLSFDNVTPKEFLEAAKSGNLEMIRRYISINGKDSAAMNVTNENGSSALVISSYYRHLPILIELLRVPLLKVHTANKYGYTALHYAAGHLPMVKELLLSSQMDKKSINASTSEKNTALILAAGDGHRDVVALLLQHQANLDIKNKNSLTAEGEARKNSHKDILELLKTAKDKKDKFEFFGQLPTQIQSEIVKNLSKKDLSHSLVSRQHAALFQPIFDERNFLHYVVCGKHEKVRAILKNNIKLLFERGSVTDCSGRTFNNISGFEYAFWAMDEHMLNKMLDCLPKNERRKQILEELCAQYQHIKIKGVSYTCMLGSKSWNRRMVEIKNLKHELRAMDRYGVSTIINLEDQLEMQLSACDEIRAATVRKRKFF